MKGGHHFDVRIKSLLTHLRQLSIEFFLVDLRLRTRKQEGSFQRVADGFYSFRVMSIQRGVITEDPHFQCLTENPVPAKIYGLSIFGHSTFGKNPISIKRDRLGLKNDLAHRHSVFG